MATKEQQATEPVEKKKRGRPRKTEQKNDVKKPPRKRKEKATEKRDIQ